MRAASNARELLLVRRQSQMTAPLPASRRVPVPKQIGQTSSAELPLSCDLGTSRFLLMLITFVSCLSDDIQAVTLTSLATFGEPIDLLRRRIIASRAVGATNRPARKC